jgi:hypothetical protein
MCFVLVASSITSFLISNSNSEMQYLDDGNMGEND